MHVKKSIKNDFFCRMSKYIIVDTLVIVNGKTFKFKELRKKGIRPLQRTKYISVSPWAQRKTAFFHS